MLLPRRFEEEDGAAPCPGFVVRSNPLGDGPDETSSNSSSDDEGGHVEDEEVGDGRRALLSRDEGSGLFPTQRDLEGMTYNWA